MMRLSLPGVVLLLWAGACRPAPPPASYAGTLARAFTARQFLPPPPDTLTLAGAYGVQAAFVAALTPELGPVAGYKAGLTTTESQARFGVPHPLHGVLLTAMLRPPGDTLAADFGARPLMEGDLLVRVGRDAINEARTDAEILAALDAVIPFLELPDPGYAPSTPLTAPALTAANVGARLGVMGAPVPLASLDDPYARLRDFRLTLVDETGTTLAEGRGSALMGHPVHVVRWIRDALRAEGRRLRPGMVLSLGSLTPLLPVPAGHTVTARYEGLGDGVRVTVTFRPGS